MRNAEQKRWVLEGICITTIFKIVAFDVIRNGGDNPWQQIDIDGFVLGSIGDVTFASMQFSADDGDMDTVAALKKKFPIGSLHWLKNESFHMIGDFKFYYPETTCPVSEEDFEEINMIFPTEVSNRAELASQIGKPHILYCGRWFRPGSAYFCYRQ